MPNRGEVLIPIDRTNKHLGNPFVLKNKNNDAEREEVIARYRDYILQKLAVGDKDAIREINRILDLVYSNQHVGLLCWCSPKKCHGDVIVEIVTDLIKHGIRELK